ncbi:hypothetical protein NK718_07845 [Alsobacter sp. SYSU M60028]|uniref:Polysaccharide biosynthesis protein n=1 Tax=Alsobacter ponti TaxID=2962936 RepID=A0ABT1LAA4_9HYPH|nr:hypothetical protein [Alsobacter ponti]MCP8938425.1 hypothetical protein [Alsobacter ponti]
MASPPDTEPSASLPAAGPVAPGRFGRIAFRELGDQVVVFLSTLAINLAAFAILFLASLNLPASDFAKLSLAAGLVPVVAAVLDLGSNQTCLKLSFEHDDLRFLGLNLVVKGFFLACVLPAAVLAYGLGFDLDRIVIGAAGAGMAFWGATRVLEQRRREFRRLAALNAGLAVTRLLLGAAALLAQSWIAVLAALHVLAQIPLHLFSVRRIAVLAGEARWRDAATILRISPVMFVSGLLYSSMPVLTQWLVFRSNDAAAAAAMGIVLIFLAPLDLVGSTLRIYLLPEVLGKPLRRIRVFGLEEAGLGWLAVGFVAAILAGTAAVTLFIHAVYGVKYPQATQFFLVYFGAMALALPVGLLNVRSQRGSLARVEAAVNVVRFGATATLGLFALSPFAVVAISAGIMLGGELALGALLTLAGNSAWAGSFSARGRD